LNSKNLTTNWEKINSKSTGQEEAKRTYDSWYPMPKCVLRKNEEPTHLSWPWLMIALRSEPVNSSCVKLQTAIYKYLPAPPPPHTHHYVCQLATCNG